VRFNIRRGTRKQPEHLELESGQRRDDDDDSSCCFDHDHGPSNQSGTRTNKGNGSESAHICATPKKVKLFINNALVFVPGQGVWCKCPVMCDEARLGLEISHVKTTVLCFNIIISPTVDNFHSFTKSP